MQNITALDCCFSSKLTKLLKKQAYLLTDTKLEREVKLLNLYMFAIKSECTYDIPQSIVDAANELCNTSAKCCEPTSSLVIEDWVADSTDYSQIWKGTDFICLADATVWQGVYDTCEQDIEWRGVDYKCLQDETVWNATDWACINKNVWKGVDWQCAQDTNYEWKEDTSSYSCVQDVELWRPANWQCAQNNDQLWRVVEFECEQVTEWKPADGYCIQTTQLWRPVEFECLQITDKLWRASYPYVCVQKEDT